VARGKLVFANAQYVCLDFIVRTSRDCHCERAAGGMTMVVAAERRRGRGERATNVEGLCRTNSSAMRFAVSQDSTIAPRPARKFTIGCRKSCL